MNALPTLRSGLSAGTVREWLLGAKGNREPTSPVLVDPETAARLAGPAADLRVTWFGHSTLVVEVEGVRFLTDPVFGDYASPGPLFGVRRFFAPPVPLDGLPPIDAVVLSHDHYDHLDAGTIQQLADRVPRFVVPLGVGAHLEAWGVAPDKITELDWWEEREVKGVRLVATPARHFSGRSLVGRDGTLWAGWAFIGARRRAYFSGDSAMTPQFAEVGDRLGPFEVAMVEVGAYDAAWSDVHMGPEQAVEAFQMARGGLLVPVHWGTFNLAFHGWTEPIERLLVAAERAGVTVAVPRPGGSVEPDAPPALERWWPQVPWRTAEEAPVVSTGLATAAA
ncbi:MAG TPA: MBL fold metallo-hydrolase [Rhodothermales bacterium]|nr:MBL fold metallo-hydrolase [Rhodothermales bacterium]